MESFLLKEKMSSPYRRHLRTMESISLRRKTFRGKSLTVCFMMSIKGNQEERKSVHTKVMKEGFIEETKFEMGNVRLVRFCAAQCKVRQTSRANHPKHR